jgi:hypothetical protein
MGRRSPSAASRAKEPTSLTLSGGRLEAETGPTWPAEPGVDVASVVEDRIVGLPAKVCQGRPPRATHSDRRIKKDTLRSGAAAIEMPFSETVFSSTKPGVAAMTINVLVLQPAIALIAGILILLIPRILNYVVALYLIIIGVTGLWPHVMVH